MSQILGPGKSFVPAGDEFDEKPARPVIGFVIGQDVFCIARGQGRVKDINCVDEEDYYPVEVEFTDSEIDWYDHDGLSMDNDKKQLFKNKSEAIEYLNKVPEKKTYVKWFNFYDDGSWHSADDEKTIDDRADEYHRTLIKKHKVEWSVIV
jgi:hypothetical protein